MMLRRSVRFKGVHITRGKGRDPSRLVPLFHGLSGGSCAREYYREDIPVNPHARKLVREFASKYIVRRSPPNSGFSSSDSVICATPEQSSLEYKPSISSTSAHCEVPSHLPDVRFFYSTT